MYEKYALVKLPNFLGNPGNAPNCVGPSLGRRQNLCHRKFTFSIYEIFSKARNISINLIVSMIKVYSHYFFSASPKKNTFCQCGEELFQAADIPRLFSSAEEIQEIMTDQPTQQPTDRQTNRHTYMKIHREVTLPKCQDISK